MENLNDGKYILMLNELWSNTSNDIILNNIITLLIDNGYKTFSKQLDELVRITGVTKHAVHAWMNHGRPNVKIPFLKLCMIAEEYDIKVCKLLIGGKFMFEKKFAITKTVGNDEEVLKFFGKDEKEAALAYGSEVAKTNDNGVISCVLAMFDEDNKMKSCGCRVFEVWR